jgi:ABC-type multidrug transport system fused ATPase/permease subunit
MLAHSFEGDEERSPLEFFHIYLTLSLVTVALYALRTWWILNSGLRAAKLVYSRLIVRILGSTIKFFDTTPVGRIVNRLSRDTKVIDEAIVDRISYLTLEVVWVLGIVVAVAYNIP